MSVVSAARRAVSGEEVLAAGVFQAAGTFAARVADIGEISARGRAREEAEASGLAFRRYVMLVVTPTRLHVFDARSGFGWKARRQLAVWPRAALRVSTELKAMTVRLTIEVPSEHRRLELEAYKSKRVAAADVVRLLTTGALPPPPDVLRAPSPSAPTLEPLEADRLEANRTTIGVLATLGGLVRAVGFFLPWIVLTGAQTENLSGAHGGAPILSIGLSIAIIVVALLYLSGRRETSPQLLRSLGLGALIASIFNFIYLSDQLGQLKAVLRARGALVTASMGIGPWVQIVGAGIVFAVGIWAVRLERGRRPSRPRTYASPPSGPATTTGR
jgi:hypothetical protein